MLELSAARINSNCNDQARGRHTYSEICVSVSWGRLQEVGTLRPGCEETWVLDKAGGQRVLLQYVPAKGRSASRSTLLSAVHLRPAAVHIFPSVGVQKLTQVVPSRGSPRLVPPSAGGSGVAAATPKLSAGAEGSCSLPHDLLPAA